MNFYKSAGLLIILRRYVLNHTAKSAIIKRLNELTVLDRRTRMETVEIKLREEFIKLGQALKAAGAAQSGVDAKFLVQDGKVTVNGQTELQRGRKLYDGDTAVCGGTCIKIVK